MDKISLYEYLQGTWKRNLTCREFSGVFEFLKQTNSLVEIKPGQGISGQCLKWSIGSKKKDLLFPKYEMEIKEKSGDTDDLDLFWEYHGNQCCGKFYSDRKLLVLNFVTNETVVQVTYRLMGLNSMSICIVESKDDNATVSLGSLHRLDVTQYTFE